LSGHVSGVGAPTVSLNWNKVLERGQNREKKVVKKFP